METPGQLSAEINKVASLSGCASRRTLCHGFGGGGWRQLAFALKHYAEATVNWRLEFLFWRVGGPFLMLVRGSNVDEEGPHQF